MEEVNSYMGRCRYCGREQAVIAHDATEADFMVTQECSCHEGNLEDQLNQMHFHLQRLIGEEAPESGFDAAEKEVIERCTEVADLVVLNKIQNATMIFDGTKLVMKNNGKKCSIVRQKQIAQGGEIQG